MVHFYFLINDNSSETLYISLAENSHRNFSRNEIIARTVGNNFKLKIMDKKNDQNRGMTVASVGGLCTILSLTLIQDKTSQVIVAGLGVVLAALGVFMMVKTKK